MGYINYESKKGRLGEDFYGECIEGIKEYIEDCGWNKTLDGESKNNNCDIEACYLAQQIWTIVMENEANLGKPFSSNELDWKKDDYEIVKFHFDIMNNPSVKNQKYSCGLARACSEDKRDEWKGIYHTIGNMAPIPWFKIEGEHFINGQNVHKALDERWDLYLSVLRNQWRDWINSAEPKLTFERYMEITCQQIFFQSVFDSVGEVNKIKLEDVEKWNKMITPNTPLISFSDSNEDTTDKMVDKIIKTIKVRNHVIGLKLQKWKEDRESSKS